MTGEYKGEAAFRIRVGSSYGGAGEGRGSGILESCTNIIDYIRERDKKRPVLVVFDYEGRGGPAENFKDYEALFISYAFLECFRMILDPQNML